MAVTKGYLYFLAALSLCLTDEFSFGNNLVRETVFLSQPTDVSKRKGETALFTCSVSGFNEESDFLTWEVKPNLYTNVISDSYNDASHVMTSSLTVFNVGLIEQTHQCIFQRINSDYTIDRCPSRVARLNIMHFPRQEDLSCGPNYVAWIPEHDLVVFWCKVRQGNPNVVVSWQVDELVTSAHPLDSADDLLTFQHHLKASEWLHNKTLLCVVASPAFPDAELSCSIGPMKILLEPSFSIFPTNVSFHLDTPDAREKLVCEGAGVHDLDSLLWSCIPPGTVLGCDGETTREIEISLNTSAYLDDIPYVTAVCYASSFEIRFYAISNITLIPKNEKKVSCIGVSIDVEDFSLLHNFSDIYYDNAVIPCFLLCDKLSANQVKFTWYVGDIMLKEDLVKVKDVTGSYKSILHLSHLSIQSNTSSLKCEASIENANMLWAEDLSLGHLFRQKGTDLPIHLDELETWTFETTREQTISWKMDELHNISLNAHGVSSSMQNDVSQEYIPKSTFPSTILNKVNPQTEISSNHELDRKTLAVVSVVGASMFILIGFLALCNAIMYRHLRVASSSQHVVKKSECKVTDKVDNDPLYEEPVSDINRLPSPIPEVQQTRKEYENKISRDSSSSESASITSSNSHSHCSLSLEYGDDSSSSNCSHCFGPLNEPGRNYDERRLSIDSNLSYERKESNYESVYDNQTVIEMHRIGKPRAERNLCSSSKNLVPDKQFRLPAFPKPKNLSSV